MTKTDKKVILILIIGFVFFTAAGILINTIEERHSTFCIICHKKSKLVGEDYCYDCWLKNKNSKSGSGSSGSSSGSSVSSNSTSSSSSKPVMTYYYPYGTGEVDRLYLGIGYAGISFESMIKIAITRITIVESALIVGLVLLVIL